MSVIGPLQRKSRVDGAKCSPCIIEAKVKVVVSKPAAITNHQYTMIPMMPMPKGWSTFKK